MSVNQCSVQTETFKQVTKTVLRGRFKMDFTVSNLAVLGGECASSFYLM